MQEVKENYFAIILYIRFLLSIFHHPKPLSSENTLD